VLPRGQWPKRGSTLSDLPEGSYQPIADAVFVVLDVTGKLVMFHNSAAVFLACL